MSPVAPLRNLLAAFAVAASAGTQAPPAWAELSLPAGVSAANATSIGKLVVYRDGGALHAWSAFTREWRTLAIGAGATLRLTNDCLLVQDGPNWHGFAAGTGRFRALPVSNGAQLLNPVGRDNDTILLVLDGGQLHAFGSFCGTWVTRAVSANVAWSVQRHVAVLYDNGVLGGLDAYTGQWHDLAVANPPLFLDTDGSAGLAVGAAEIHAFSAVHASWNSAPALPGATMTRDDDWALFWDGAQMLAYSGIQGRFEYAPLGAVAVPYHEDLFVIADTALGLVAWSAIRGSFSAPLGPGSSRVRPNVAVAVLVDGLQVTGYSAARNTSATIVLDSTTEEAASSAAYALQNGTALPWCFSGATGQWYAPPAGVLPGPPLLATTSALLPTASGALAFSARTGTFVPLAAAGATLAANGSSAVAAAWDQTALHAFDARTDRWRSLPRTGTGAPIVQLWRTSLFAIDGNVAAGFGSQRGEWATTVLPGPYVAGRANSESARVVLANHVFAHSALSELVSFAQFPDFRRVHPAGAIARFALPVGAGGFALFGAGSFAGSPLPLPPFGTLLLDAGSLVTSLVTPAPGEDRALLVLPVPPSAGLVGSTWAFQALAVPAGGQPWLSGAATLTVL